MDRTEAAGFGVAVAGHAAVLAALVAAIGQSGRIPPPGPPSIEVSFVDEVGLTSGAPAMEPAAQSVAPELGRPEQAAAEPMSNAAAAASRPAPQPAPSNAAPPRPMPQPQRQGGSGSASANRGSRLGADFLKGLGNDPASAAQRTTGATMTARAQADIASLIVRQVQPCADRQRSPGPGAERIVVTIRLRLNRNGSLAAPPTVVGSTADETNRRYLERVTDNAIATFTGCSPLRGLPPELYDVPRGWRDFRLRYRLPG